jgi:hypothetical protein
MAEEIKVTSKEITIWVRGEKKPRTLVVRKAVFEEKLKRFTLIEEIEKNLNGEGVLPEGAGLEAMVRLGFKKMTYPSLVTCTTGKVPTEAECYQVDEEDLELWLTTARELNPTWFPVSTETATESIEKKEP